MRTTSRTVSFARPFRLAGLDMSLPAGDYLVETDEEQVAHVSYPAWKRVQTVLHLPANPGQPPDLTRTVPIDPTELESALTHDGDTGPPTSSEK